MDISAIVSWNSLLSTFISRMEWIGKGLYDSLKEDINSLLEGWLRTVLEGPLSCE